MSVVLYVTQFADAPVLVGLTAVMCAALSFAGCFRAAATFGLVFITLVVCVVAAKGAVASIPGLSDATGLQSPSGHVAGAIVVISGAAICAGRGSWTLAAAIGAVVIAYTRVALGFHTIVDVLAGAAIGTTLIISATLLGVTRSWSAVPRPVGAPLLGLMVAAAIFLNGWHPGLGRSARAAGSDFPSWRGHSQLDPNAMPRG